MVDLSGQSLGQYFIKNKIGQGGMASVYQAVQTTLQRDVAIKVIPAHVAQRADNLFLDSFAAEARMAANMSHPYIVTIHDFGVSPEWAYLVMEYVHDGSIRDHMVKASKLGQRLSLTWSLMALEQAAQALDYAHEKQVVHRDVKPANMLLRNPNLVVLSDFGVAKMLLDRTIIRGAQRPSEMPRVVGTPQYMSPEQCRATSALDGRSDIYSLGVTLYQCATGLLPFIGSNDEVMRKQIYETPPRPSAVATLIPPEVERIILTAMAKDPNQRYQHARDMAADMHAVRVQLEGGEVGSPRAPAPRTMPMRVPQGIASGPAAPVAPARQGQSGALGVCFRCGAQNRPDNQFCTACGYDIAANRYSEDRYLATTGRPLRCRLIFLNGPLARQIYMLHQDVTMIGRGQGNDVLLRDGSISRQHARLTFMGGQWVIEDLSSANGVFVNRTRVRRPLALAHGDRVRMGDVELIYELVQ